MASAFHRSSYDIYGVRVDLRADHRLLFETLDSDLSAFRVSGEGRRGGAVRIRLRAMTDGPGREIATHHRPGAGSVLVRYARAAITVLQRLDARTVEASVAPEPSVLPDPAYHYVFTQPVNPWLKRRGLFFLHAACVARGGKGVLLVGASKAGKSTLSVSAARAGWSFLGDEQPILARRGGRVRALAFPRRVRLDRRAAALLPELRPLLDSRGPGRLVFPLRDLWPDAPAPSCEPRAVVFPRFARRGGLRARRLEPAAALALLLQDDHFAWYRDDGWRGVSRAHLAVFESLLRQAKAFTLDYGAADVLKVPSLLGRLLHA